MVQQRYADSPREYAPDQHVLVILIILLPYHVAVVKLKITCQFGIYSVFHLESKYLCKCYRGVWTQNETHCR